MSREAADLKQGVVAVVARQDRWLVIQRSHEVRAPGCYCFPGGGVESGESEGEALCRELSEELSAEVRPLQRLWSSRTTWGVQLSWWQAELVTPADQLQPNPEEVLAFHWLAPEEIARLPRLLSSNHDFLDAWRREEFVLW